MLEIAPKCQNFPLTGRLRQTGSTKAVRNLPIRPPKPKIILSEEAGRSGEATFQPRRKRKAAPSHPLRAPSGSHRIAGRPQPPRLASAGDKRDLLRLPIEGKRRQMWTDAGFFTKFFTALLGFLLRFFTTLFRFFTTPSRQSPK
jgi:hypothetical protein